eukprot:10345310-Prorocentrum_lima.AAC.1
MTRRQLLGVGDFDQKTALQRAKIVADDAASPALMCRELIGPRLRANFEPRIKGPAASQDWR